jgi:hypothetical protein
LQTIQQLEEEMLGGQRLQGPETAMEVSALLKAEGLENRWVLVLAKRFVNGINARGPCWYHAICYVKRHESGERVKKEFFLLPPISIFLDSHKLLYNLVASPRGLL